MDFRLPPELDALKNVIRQVVKEECIPLESNFLAHLDFGTLPDGALERLKKVSRETGIYSAHLPEKYGGGGMGTLGAIVGDEEAARSIVRLPICHVPNIVVENCTKEQEEKYVLPSIRGEMKACFAQTEPQSGTDIENALRTRAVRRGGDWVINGTKAFISDADGANYMMLLAVTDQEKTRDGGITMFLVDRDLPGITTSPIRTWLTPGGVVYSIYLDEVRVPGTQVLGEVGNGYFLGQRWLGFHDRMMKCSTTIGILTRALEMAVGWSKQRITFGHPISDRQAIQWMLADIYITITTLRRLVYEAAWRYDRGESIDVAVSLVKYCAAEWGWRSIDNIMQIFGGLGEAMETPIPHWYHSLRHSRIGGGTSEMMRWKIAQAVIDSAISWEA